jgi:hypothetical protein
VNEDPLDVARQLGSALERVGARWAVGGSVATSVHGMPRSTVNVDVIVALPSSKVADFAIESAAEFDLDEESLREQIRQGRSYNIFHRTTTTKVDLFPAIGRFERNQLDRSVVVAGVRVIAPEDALLAKLRWYRMGGEISDRQWRDIAGLIAVSGPRLDLAHLHTWAAEMGIADLLARALADSSGGF